MDESKLSAEDRLTNNILLYISSCVPYTIEKYHGIPTDLIVKSQTREKVQEVLDNMAADRLKEMMDLVLVEDDDELLQGMDANNDEPQATHNEAMDEDNESPPNMARALPDTPTRMLQVGGSSQQVEDIPEQDPKDKNKNTDSVEDSVRRKSSHDDDHRKPGKKPKKKGKDKGKEHAVSVPLDEKFLEQSYE